MTHPDTYPDPTDRVAGGGRPDAPTEPCGVCGRPIERVNTYHGWGHVDRGADHRAERHVVMFF